MACNHLWQRYNEVHICVKCGLTKLSDGTMFFDRKYSNRTKTNKRNKKVKNNG